MAKVYYFLVPHCNSSRPLGEIINDKTLFRDLPKGGPLERYRKIASFDWRKMALALDQEKCIRFRVTVFLFIFEASVYKGSFFGNPMDNETT